jgi:carbamate kinase
MKPKVEATSFAADAIIARLAGGPAALRGHTGTTIVRG